MRGETGDMRQHPDSYDKYSVAEKRYARGQKPTRGGDLKYLENILTLSFVVVASRNLWMTSDVKSTIAANVAGGKQTCV
jgi:hypothetical protein